MLGLSLSPAQQRRKKTHRQGEQRPEHLDCIYLKVLCVPR